MRTYKISYRQDNKTVSVMFKTNSIVKAFRVARALSSHPSTVVSLVC
jgi:hypothetical protein